MRALKTRPVALAGARPALDLLRRAPRIADAAARGLPFPTTGSTSPADRLVHGRERRPIGLRPGEGHRRVPSVMTA